MLLEKFYKKDCMKPRLPEHVPKETFKTMTSRYSPNSLASRGVSNFSVFD